VPQTCHSSLSMAHTHGDSRAAKTAADLDNSRFHQIPRLSPKQQLVAGEARMVQSGELRATGGTRGAYAIVKLAG
jgi:hypothetical protein